MNSFVNNKHKSSNKDSAIITRTPLRITLAGGGTDVLWYSKLKGGAWISATINRYVNVKVINYVNPLSLLIHDNGNDLHYKNLDELDNPIIKECLKMAQIDGGLEITTQSDVPPKSGLGGSGAFEVGLLNALHVYKNKPVSPLVLAKQAADIEIENLKKPVGPQDQYITALGGIKYFEIDKNGKVSFENLNLSESSLKELQSNLLFFQTDIYHDTEKILGDQKEKAKDSNQQVIEALDQIKELGQQAKKYLLSDQIDTYGKTLHEHWLIKKKLSDKVTSSQIDSWYDLGIENGALGGKILGAGGGGWLVFYVNRNHQQFIEKLSQNGLTYQQVSFEFIGTR